MLDLPDEQVVVKGPARTIAYAIDANGRMPAREFLEATKGKGAPTEREKAGLYVLFQRMGEHGSIRNTEQFRKEQSEIYGFKKAQARVAAFQVSTVWFLTHGFKKKQPRWPASELKRAERIRIDHLNSTRRTS